MVDRTVGINDKDHGGRVIAETVAREIERKALAATIRVEAFDHVNSDAARDRRSRIRAIVGHEKDPGTAVGRLLEFPESRFEDLRLIMRWNDDDHLNESGRQDGLGQRAQSDEDLDREAKGQQKEGREAHREDQGHKQRLSNIVAVRDCMIGTSAVPNGDRGNLRQTNGKFSVAEEHG